MNTKNLRTSIALTMFGVLSAAMLSAQTATRSPAQDSPAFEKKVTQRLRQVERNSKANSQQMGQLKETEEKNHQENVAAIAKTREDTAAQLKADREAGEKARHEFEDGISDRINRHELWSILLVLIGIVAVLITIKLYGNPQSQEETKSAPDVSPDLNLPTFAGASKGTESVLQVVPRISPDTLLNPSQKKLHAIAQKKGLAEVSFVRSLENGARFACSWNDEKGTVCFIDYPHAGEVRYREVVDTALNILRPVAKVS